MTTTTYDQSTGRDTGALQHLLDDGDGPADGENLLSEPLHLTPDVAAPVGPAGMSRAVADPEVVATFAPAVSTPRVVDVAASARCYNSMATAAAFAGFATPSTHGLLHDSTPDAAAFTRHFACSVRTAAPLLAADLFTLAAAGGFAELLLSIMSPGSTGLIGPAAAIALLPLVAGYWLVGLYSEVWIHPAVELRQSTQVTTLALSAVVISGLWAPADALPLAAWCLFAWATAVVILPLARSLARRCCAGRAWWGFPTLIIGSGAGADRLARMLSRSPTAGLRPALLTDPDGLCRASVVPVMNDPGVLRSMARSKGIRHAVLCISDLSATKVAAAFDQYGALASHLLVVCDTPPIPSLWGAQRVCGLGGIEVRNGLLLAPLRIVKRATDIALATAALVFGMPLYLTVALLVKLSGPGGVFYGHRRIGLRGQTFTAWKFRTMHKGADILLRQHFQRFPSARLEWERDQKLRDDPRVTRVGRILRQLSLDELPQMWNVLRGEMSVVGPRPIVDDEVARYGGAFETYAGVKPGITGLWQVSGRTDVGYDLRVKLDEFYVRHWSPWLDAYLLVRTVVALLRRKGAY